MKKHKLHAKPMVPCDIMGQICDTIKDNESHVGNVQF